MWHLALDQVLRLISKGNNWFLPILFFFCDNSSTSKRTVTKEGGALKIVFLKKADGLNQEVANVCAGL